VFSTFKDRQGTVWAGTYYGGVHYFNPETDCFTYYSSNPKRNDCLSHFFVGKMVEDRDSNVWICTEGGGLNFFDRQTKRFKYFLADGNSNSIAHNNLKTVAYSSKYNRLYIGTHTGGVSVYDIDRGVFHNFRDRFPDYHKSTGDIIDHVQIFRDDTLIILGRNGFFKFDMSTERLLPMFDGIINRATFLIDSKDRLWTANNSTVTLINMNAPDDIAVYNYGKRGLGRFGVSCIAEDGRGRIFFGTSGSGLYQYVEEADSFRAFTAEKNLLLSNYCYDIALSKENNELIVSGDKGLSFLNVDRNELRMIDLHSLIFSGLTFGNKMLVCGNGEVFVGGIGGMTSFFDGEALGINKEYEIYFSSLEVNGDRISPSDRTKILCRAMPFTDAITLGYKQNNINISFASNDYTDPHNPDLYEYKLEGFDNNWTSGNNIVYTNIRPGQYRLTVRENAMNADAGPKFLQMNITIRHPWYANRFAYAFYFTVALVIIRAFMRLSKARMKLRNSLEMERKEKENIEKLNQSKLQFFSNISHEFNTPLTLITVQIERLLNNSVSPFVYNKLLKINKNVIHLRNLIGELLDFRKLEQGHVRLKVRELDLIPFLKEIYFYFYELSAGRNMTYRFDAPETAPVLLWFDPRQMQKVFYNLISNAFKYTEENDTIEISVSQDDTSVKIKVIDNGIGIETDDINRIFERFYQVDGSKQNFMNAPSTGIGLSVVKAILDLHRGTVTVESKPRYGSIFIVTLLKGNSHFDSEEIVRTTEVEYVKTDTAPPHKHLAGEEMQAETVSASASASSSASGETSLSDDKDDMPADGRKSTALIVEDNKELLLVLRDILSPMYSVLTANDGKEGLSIACREKPDLIISDVMMPGMSGTELCMDIKNNFDTCHIPVILLTALSSVEQNIYGLQHGADDYIAKPFDANNLVARCNNLIRNRTIIKNKFGSNANFDMQSVSTNPIDQNFIDRINGIVEKNMNNPDFNVNILASELNLSRSSLYSKFESLTGMTPNDYVMLRRLKKAADMLLNNRNANISEVSDYFCFGSPKYFSRCFKKQFNVSPAEYRKK
jgi:signal transduction histidine kinase/DNA-binding response OmpR family regulator